MLPRVFRPTMMAAQGIDNTDLGVCFAVYGFVALGSYLFGGPLADRFPPRRLMGTALLLTAAVGPIYAAAPGLTVLKIIYGYWGFTTIFLFWAAMIKATRVWGGVGAQGLAFGFLDGGRGLVGALFGLLGLSILQLLGTEGGSVALVAEEAAASYRTVVLATSALVALVGGLVFFFLRTDSGLEDRALVQRITWSEVRAVLRLPAVWLLMVIILCAYVGYRVTDIISLYSKDVMGYNDIESARTGTFLLIIRPIVGVTVGFLADRARPSLYLMVGFALTLAGGWLFAAGGLAPGGDGFFFASIGLLAVGVYAARVLYFAVLPEGGIPLLLTGTAVGLISFVGYTPDIFAALLFGYYLDAYPGAEGHTYVFYILMAFSAVGLVAAAVLWRISATRKAGDEGADAGAGH